LINVKWGGIAAGLGFIVSLVVGVLSGAGFPLLLIRALVFGAVFFALGGGVWILINTFIPELLFPENDEADSSDDGQSPGSKVDISVDDGQDLALPEKYGFGSGDDVGNITDLLNGKTAPENNTGMDQKGEDGYTKIREAGFQTEAGAVNSVPAAAGVYDDSAGALPDLDSMAAAFVPSSVEPSGISTEPPPPVRSPSGNKPQSLKGDFNPKDLAAAIRTKISKE
jgi:hypothetical protein